MIGKIINKFRQDGFRGLFKAGRVWLTCVVNNVLFYIFRCFPIKDDLIVFESEGDFCDNSYALYDYMRRNGYFKKYRAVWLVENTGSFRKKSFDNTVFCYKFANRFSPGRDYYLAVCRHFIYDHCLVLPCKRKNQTVTFISHGAGFKASKGSDDRDLNGIVDNAIATGIISGECIGKFWKYDEKNMLHLGYPRNDYFYSDLSEARFKIQQKYGTDKYNKVILWMPTFRQSRVEVLSEDYLSSGTGLPLLDSMEKYINFNSFLKENNLLLILKVHQLSADLSIYKTNVSNIIIVKNEDIHGMGIQLYQFVAFSDMLITDYSSISTDYLLLDKPIVYTLDDYAEYERSRGIYPKNAIDYMAGYHVYSVSDLTDAIDEIKNGTDKFREKRAEVRKEYHDHTDGNSSKRIVEYLGL